MTFNSKTTKSEIIRAYEILLAEKEALEKVVPSEVNDVEGLSVALEGMQKKASMLMSKQDQQLYQLISAARKLKWETNQSQQELQNAYGVEVDTEEQLVTVLRSFENLREDRKAHIELLLKDHKDKVEELCTERERLVKSLREKRDVKLREHRTDISRALEEFGYAKARDKGNDEIADGTETKRVQEEAEELRRDFAKYKSSKEEALGERSRKCELLKQEVEELRKKYKVEKDSAYAKGASKAKAEGYYELQKATSGWESEKAQREGDIEAFKNEIERNEKIKRELSAKLNRVEEDIQALSQASITASTNGSTLALHAVEKIALEQARSSVNGKR